MQHGCRVLCYTTGITWAVWTLCIWFMWSAFHFAPVWYGNECIQRQGSSATLTHIHKRRSHGMCANLYDVGINFYGWFSFVAHFHAHFALSICFIKRLAFCCRCNCEWWRKRNNDIFCRHFTKRLVVQVSKLVKWHLNVCVKDRNNANTKAER